MANEKPWKSVDDILEVRLICNGCGKELTHTRTPGADVLHCLHCKAINNDQYGLDTLILKDVVSRLKGAVRDAKVKLPFEVRLIIR